MPKPEIRERNFTYFQANLPNWLTDPAYKHKFVVIHNQQIKGVFDQFSAALEFAVANHPPDEFVIQQVLAEHEQINYIRAAI